MIKKFFKLIPFIIFIIYVILLHISAFYIGTNIGTGLLVISLIISLLFVLYYNIWLGVISQLLLLIISYFSINDFVHPNSGNIMGVMANFSIIYMVDYLKKTLTRIEIAEKKARLENKNLENLNKEYAVQNEKLTRAEESERLKSAFLANMSHEIRTPMNAIIGFTSLLKRSKIKIKERDKYIDIIQDSGNHLLNLINDIIDLSKFEAKQLKLIEEECNLNQFLTEIEDSLSSLYKNKSELKVVFNTCLPDEQDRVKTDLTRLRQILTNLIGNAVKYTEDGAITVNYSILNNKLIQFSIKDTGIGISKENIDIIFKRFRQGDDSSARKYGGTGLGLSITKACVELFGGEIWVDSEIGKGATFYFTIPYKPIKTKLTIKQAGTDLTFENLFIDKTILIAEDDVFSFMILKELLATTKVKIIHATTGLQVVEICESNPQIDLILMDIQLPKKNGLEATRKIKETHQNLPIIAQTANATQEDKAKVFSAGCDDFITKPIDEAELLNKIAKLLQ